MNEKFYILNDNKNNAIVVSGSEEIALEGAKLQELVSRSVEAATEKHIPVVSVNSIKEIRSWAKTSSRVCSF